MLHEIVQSVLGKGAALAFAVLPVAPLMAQMPSLPRVKNIVLVHGAFADGNARSVCGSWPDLM